MSAYIASKNEEKRLKNRNHSTELIQIYNDKRKDLVKQREKKFSA